jgi:hypothetical protein
MELNSISYKECRTVQCIQIELNETNMPLCEEASVTPSGQVSMKLLK